MMIGVTVKTLDSQNHFFEVDDEITVHEFKEKIMSSVSVPADRQRLIYCGRVMQDSKKLNEYDVHGKVIHLVQRPPPELLTTETEPRSSTTEPRWRISRQRRSGNQIYFGSFSFPDDGFTVPGIGPSSASVRLNVARNMFQRASVVLDELESVSSNNELSQASASQNISDIAMNIINDSNENTNVNNDFVGQEALGSTLQMLNAAHEAVLSAATQSGGLENLTNVPVQPQSIVYPWGGELQLMQVSVGINTINNGDSQEIPVQNSVRATEDANVDITTPNVLNETSSNSAGGATGPTSDFRRPQQLHGIPEHPPTSEIVQVLNQLNSLHQRLQPFLNKYYDYMNEDPAFSDESGQRDESQRIFNKVSEIFHFLAHGYHALSDIMCDFSRAPPRELRARPFVLQQPAAQINLSDGQVNRDATANSTSNTNSGTAPLIPDTHAQTEVPSLSETQNVGLEQELRPNINEVSTSVEIQNQTTDTRSETRSNAPPSTQNAGHLEDPVLRRMLDELLDVGLLRMQVLQQGDSARPREREQTRQQAGPVFSMAGSYNDPFLQCTSHHWYRNNRQQNIMVSREISRLPVTTLTSYSRPTFISNIPTAVNRHSERAETQDMNTTIENDLNILNQNLSGLVASSSYDNFLHQLITEAFRYIRMHAVEGTHRFDSQLVSDQNIIANLKEPLTQYFKFHISQEYQENSEISVEFFLEKLQPYIIATAKCAEKCNYIQHLDVFKTFHNFVRVHLSQFFFLLKHGPQKSYFAKSLLQQLKSSVDQFQRLCLYCFQDQQSQLVKFLMDMKNVIKKDVPPTLLELIDEQFFKGMKNLIQNENGHEDILVYLAQRESTSTDIVQQSIAEEAMEVTDIPTNIAANHWETVLPADWVPIIRADFERQRRTSVSSNFSDAYLSILPRKRRRVFEEHKLSTDMTQCLNQLLTRALEGIAAPVNSFSINNVISNTELQHSYQLLLRDVVKERVHGDPNYDPDKFPNICHFLNN